MRIPVDRLFSGGAETAPDNVAFFQRVGLAAGAIGQLNLSAAWLCQLNGTKRLVVGNHDFKGPTLQLGWASIDQLTETVVDGQTLVLCHYSLRVWRNMRRGALMLYGHSHGNLPGNRQSMDVGVDCTGYAPLSLPQIRSMLARLPSLEFRAGTDETDGGSE
jgi:calcineurin-like phosphoesterase family protein